jgi:hypothetical protein
LSVTRNIILRLFEVEPGFDGSALDTDTASPAGTFFKILLERAVVALLVGRLLVLVEVVALAAFPFTKDDDSLPSFRSFRFPPQNRKLLRFSSVSPMVTYADVVVLLLCTTYCRLP